MGYLIGAMGLFVLGWVVVRDVKDVLLKLRNYKYLKIELINAYGGEKYWRSRFEDARGIAFQYIKQIESSDSAHVIYNKKGVLQKLDGMLWAFSNKGIAKKELQDFSPVEDYEIKKVKIIIED